MEPTIKIVNDGKPHTPSRNNTVCEEYIISANVSYQRQLDTLRAKLNETETERAELETDNDKIETSQR